MSNYATGSTLRRNIRGVEALELYVERNGTALVPIDTMQDGFRLGQWVSYIRARRSANPNSVAKDLSDRLEVLPNWTWGPVPRGPKRSEERNAEIVRMHAEGVTLAKIGEKFGVSRQRVHQIINRELAGTK